MTVCSYFDCYIEAESVYMERERELEMQQRRMRELEAIAASERRAARCAGIHPTDGSFDIQKGSAGGSGRLTCIRQILEQSAFVLQGVKS